MKKIDNVIALLFLKFLIKISLIGITPDVPLSLGGGSFLLIFALARGERDDIIK